MTDNSDEEYLFIIYSCQKNLLQAEQVYERVNGKLLNCKVCICYGTAEEKADDKYIALKCSDDYDHLSDKTLLLLQMVLERFPSKKGMFKCDDDIIVNLEQLNNLMKGFNVDMKDYVGRPVIRTEENIKKHPDKHPLLPAIYCAGPLYFISKKALECFTIKETILRNYYEDVMVGYHLNKNDIFPEKDHKYILYSDVISASDKVSYQNKNHFNELYVIIKGGLGNQLFQLACAFKMAEKYKKKVVLNINAILANPHQGWNKERTLNTLLRLFPTLEVVQNKLDHEHFHTFNEEHSKCFLYTPSKLEDCFQTYCNVGLHGYFINANYIPSAEENVFNHVNIIPDDKTLLSHNFEHTYFIHIRLGDYVNNPLYSFNLKKYYAHCINAIKHINPLAKFYVCTNQFDINMQNYLKSFPLGNEYRVQAANNNDIDTLYIMSRCQGAICSNSTLSYMGAYFQKNKSKNKETIFMPYPFVNFINGFNKDNVTGEMYPEWCRVYDTIKSEAVH
jgi:hypothetical protein